VQNQQLTLDLINYQKSDDDLILLKQSKRIVDGLESIKEGVGQKQVSVLSNMDTIFRPVNQKGFEDISFKELVA